MQKLFAMILALALFASLRGEIRLRGVMKDGDGHLFSLSDSDERIPSRWVALGSVFGGYFVVSYDSRSGVVRLRKGEREIDAKLQAPPVKAENEPLVDIRTLGDEELASLGLYRIKPGDTGAKIARSLKITIDALRLLNPEVQLSRLRVGQILVGPGPTGTSPPPPAQTAVR